MAEAADWSSLPSDLVNRLLATNDVDCYIDFRAVCNTWCSATTDTKNSPDKHFHPSQWVVIDEVSYSLEFQHRTCLFMNTTTGRILRKDLPMLRNYYVIATTLGGFFVLADKKPPHATCVLNPFTGYMVRYMAPMVTYEVASAAVIGPTLVLFCDICRMICSASVDSGGFDLYMYQSPYKNLGLLGASYTGHDDVTNKIVDLMRSFVVHSTVYPFEEAVDHYGARNTDRWFVVKSASQLLMIFKMQECIQVFRVDNNISMLEPVKSTGNRAIFLGYRQCMSVNADKFQTVESNCIYYVKCSTIYKYDLKDEKEERISGAINTLSHASCFKKRLSTHVFLDPPFTIIQLLSSYTFNSWGSELRKAKFEMLPDVIPDAENFRPSAFLEDLEFVD